ncbi:MAG: zinc-binding dehydrogenase [Candidatus Omnitrophica bacterium]|nr:zinc-binding dehydrogenase [Candidatus Omnitrophota bacterium]
MKAVYFDHHGDVNVLQYGDRPDPVVGERDVLVRLKAASINHLDIWVRQGMPGVTIPLPHILGNEGAGEVAAVGKLVTHVKPGDHVLVAPGMCCGECDYCAEGWDSACAQYKLIGYQIDGCYAELVKAPARNVIPISNKLSFKEWASIPLVFITAWHMLITRAKLQPGETVLIQAAGSGIGIAATQIAKLTGATVIATAGSDEKLKRAKSLGADYGINYSKEDTAEKVRDITKDHGVHVVFEHVGPATWPSSMKSLAKLGRLVTCGATSGAKVELDLRFLFSRQFTILGSYMGGRFELDKVLELIEAGKLKPVIDKTFPLKDARAAHEHMLDRKNFGKIVLEI